ncbi:tyrosine-type recombinase/integrase [Kribbella qitaiheensis]|uniref:tyrosine-type recombinase/integrase n=1 Tax=Kribbella qitaiheensis TaxID=1544730 RepID=UPI003622C020
MGHVKDLWTKPGPNGRRVRSDRYGQGKRWLARWVDPTGREESRAFKSKDAAQDHIARMDISVRDGSYLDPRSGRQTFREYAEKWRADQLHHRVATATQTESRLRLHAYPVFGDKPISMISRRDIQDAINLATKKLDASTVDTFYGRLVAVFSSAVLDRVIRDSPCVKISLPEITKPPVVVLGPDQVSKIRLAMPERYAAAVTVAAASGLRPGELFGLTVDRLEGSCDNVVLVVDRQQARKAGTWGPPKTATSNRRVELGLFASRALWAHLNRFGEGWHGHVFTTRRQTEVSKTTQGQVWGGAIGGMNLPDRSGWHALRHHHASVLIRAGLSVPAVADRLGHKNQKETYDTYVHLWPDDKDRIVAAVDAALAGL